MVIAKKSLYFIFFEYAIIIASLALSYYSSSLLIKILIFIVISTRQHALWMIFHDAVHFHLAKNKRLNDNLAYIFLSVPLLLPLNIFRDIHLSHHAYVGTDKDPERHILYRFQPWNYGPLSAPKLLIQFIGDIFLFNNIVALFLPFIGKSKSSLRGLKPYFEYYLYNVLFIGMFVYLYQNHYEWFVHLMIFWIVPILTLGHFWHKLRSFAEHSSDEVGHTYSWKVSFLGRATIWPYHINYHREHHDNPSVPWFELPLKFQHVKQKPEVGIFRHLLKFRP